MENRKTVRARDKLFQTCLFQEWERSHVASFSAQAAESALQKNTTHKITGRDSGHQVTVKAWAGGRERERASTQLTAFCDLGGRNRRGRQDSPQLLAVTHLLPTPGLLTSLQPGQLAHVGTRGSAGYIHSKNSKTTTEPGVYFYAPLTVEECVIFSKRGEYVPLTRTV